MPTLRRHQILRRQILWMLAVGVVLSLFDALSLPLFLSAALVGFLVVVEMGTPRYVEPPWTARLRQVALVALAAFAIYVAYRMAMMVPSSAM